MNKYQTFLRIRHELAADYKKEILATRELIHNGLSAIMGPRNRLALQDQENLASLGEARKQFREELETAVRPVLERYERKLISEVEGLGINDSRMHFGPQGEQQVERVVAEQAAALAQREEFEGRTTQDGPANGGGELANAIVNSEDYFIGELRTAVRELGVQPQMDITTKTAIRR